MIRYHHMSSETTICWSYYVNGGHRQGLKRKTKQVGRSEHVHESMFILFCAAIIIILCLGALQR